MTSTVDEDVIADVGFLALYRAEYPKAVRLAYLLSFSAESAEDIVQDSFLRVHRRFAALDNPAAYLHTTVVNRCREVARRRDTERRGLERLGPPEDRLPFAGSELLDVVAALPTRQRTVLVLRYWADWSEADIAAALGCRPGTVKSLASRALARLRRELG